MKYETVEKLTTIGMIGSVTVSLVACAWFCVSQHKVAKNTGRIADVFERLESKDRL